MGRRPLGHLATWPQLTTDDGRLTTDGPTTNANDSQHFCNCHNVVFVLAHFYFAFPIAIIFFTIFTARAFRRSHFIFSAFCFAHCANLALLFPKANNKKTQRQQRPGQDKSSRG